LGLVFEYGPDDEAAVAALCAKHDIPFKTIGVTSEEPVVSIAQGANEIFSASIATLLRQWSATSARLEEEQTDRDCARSELTVVSRAETPRYHLSFTPAPTAADLLARRDKPKVAVLREEGTNADREMAAACIAAGLEPWDIAMSDLLAGKVALEEFRGVMFCGGFSFMDVFGSAKGWAAAIRFNDGLRQMFDDFHERPDTLSLGACNGCQLMALLGWATLNGVPDTSQPRFVQNASGRFESRWTRVKVLPSPSVHLAGMEGSILGIWSEHGEGRLVHPDPREEKTITPLVFVDAEGNATGTYPYNPNGSPGGQCALASPDGRHLALMPHPERSFLPWQWEWMPPAWKRFGVSPWLRLSRTCGPGSTRTEYERAAHSWGRLRRRRCGLSQDRALQAADDRRGEEDSRLS
ncbi:MAG: phosphoribosylformylglycinamidine synthase subunit PurQ, partial [Rhizobiales bacterium]|nr:phosphoribosylformylglycinamidine synthase subunit PurQ [Hyphomicrobiales bacterium]